MSQTSNKKDKILAQQKEGGKQGRSLSSFYQQATSQPTSSRREEEQEKELQETISPKLQYFKNPEIFKGQFLQHGQSLDGIQRQRGTKNEKIPILKEVTLSPDIGNTLTEIKNGLLSLTHTVVQNKKEIDNLVFMVENNEPKVLIENTQKSIKGKQELYKYIRDIR
ncbi:hypothetical protein O181_079164 [Austropuccinia psidii MF-1]|uniref:Uncharacterized protein n=1 Tax=Austropuccinia psidii MF-1 TaxID=1389203 RepID=A0A9Q3FIC5_9BASI|nr:hypothetical protein [Austropuccinia psidii MF-1]